MNFYKIILEYRGTNYHGFQIQNDANTIQGELYNALKNLGDLSQIKTIGSGRTDAGVHAKAQVVRIEMPLKMPGDKLLFALNAHLPKDIRVIHSEECDDKFHPIFSAQKKEYRYYFSTNEFSSTHLHGLIAFYPHKLDWELMKKGCELFLGKHDFINYQCRGTEVETTVREIFEAEIIETHFGAEFPFSTNNVFCFRVVGDGFLKQMVRLMVGALWNLGRHKITLEDFKESLQVARESRYGIVAPPDGLYLYRVDY